MNSYDNNNDDLDQSEPIVLVTPESRHGLCVSSLAKIDRPINCDTRWHNDRLSRSTDLSTDLALVGFVTTKFVEHTNLPGRNVQVGSNIIVSNITHWRQEQFSPVNNFATTVKLETADIRLFNETRS